MKTIILQSNNEPDLTLLLQLAERLGIRFFEAKKDIVLEEIADAETLDREEFLSAVPDSSALYEGLNLPAEPKFYKLEEMPTTYEKLKSRYYIPDFSLAKSAFGAWENDEDETLEDLLNMLTP
ncbi:MAG: hypothetical protein NW226_10940 [Microscillaceae bacterium]|nr:hypothetical protein [Microscillaceae bacterium]